MDLYIGIFFIVLYKAQNEKISKILINLHMENYCLEFFYNKNMF